MEEYRIDRRAMKLDARGAMHDHKPSVYMVAFVFLLITLVLDSLSTKLQFPGLRIGEIMRYTYSEDQVMRLWQAASQRSGSSRLLDLAIAIMSGPLMMVQTIWLELNYGASSRLAPSSTAMTDIPAKNSVIYRYSLFFRIPACMAFPSQKRFHQNTTVPANAQCTSAAVKM